MIVGNPDVIKNLDDIAGKTVAWGDPASTSSHLIPKAMLVEQADLIVDEGNYQEQHVGAHDAVDDDDHRMPCVLERKLRLEQVVVKLRLRLFEFLFGNLPILFYGFKHNG